MIYCDPFFWRCCLRTSNEIFAALAMATGYRGLLRYAPSGTGVPGVCFATLAVTTVRQEIATLAMTSNVGKLWKNCCKHLDRIEQLFYIIDNQKYLR